MYIFAGFKSMNDGCYSMVVSLYSNSFRLSFFNHNIDSSLRLAFWALLSSSCLPTSDRNNSPARRRQPWPLRELLMSVSLSGKQQWGGNKYSQGEKTESLEDRWLAGEGCVKAAAPSLANRAWSWPSTWSPEVGLVSAEQAEWSVLRGANLSRDSEQQVMRKRVLCKSPAPRASWLHCAPENCRASWLMKVSAAEEERKKNRWIALSVSPDVCLYICAP